MEYVGGQSLRDLLLAHRDADGGAALPLAQVLAYGLEILPALGYLHDRDLLYCDFKPDNVIHADDQLKLIDLGAVRRIDDTTSAPSTAPPATRRPRWPRVGPSVASDIYTVGRAAGRAQLRLPRLLHHLRRPAARPRRGPRCCAAEESFYRLLRRATHRDPRAPLRLGRRRWPSSCSACCGRCCRPPTACRGRSRRRSSPASGGRSAPTPACWPAPVAAGDDGRASAPAAVAAALPLPLLDPADPGAGYLATRGHHRPGRAGRGRCPRRRCSRWRSGCGWCGPGIEQGDPAGALADLDSRRADPLDWRLDWYRGLAALAGRDGRPTPARRSTPSTASCPASRRPGWRWPPRAERDGDAGRGRAPLRAGVAWSTADFVSAAFGLARLRLARGDRAGCVAVLDEVPDSSSQYHTAQVAAVRARVGAELAHVLEADLLDASTRLERLRLGVERNAWLAAEMLERSLLWVGRAQPTAGSRVLGHELTERGLRLGLEQAYRSLAKMAPDAASRDRAGWTGPTACAPGRGYDRAE